MNKWIEQALAHQRENNLELSAQCYARAFEEDPDDKDVLYFAALFLFNMRDYEKALDVFVQCYSNESQTDEKKQEILSSVLAAYYEPNVQELKKTYERNVQNLLAYEHNYIETYGGPLCQDSNFWNLSYTVLRTPLSIIQGYTESRQ